MKIYVACLAAYNAGILHGAWIDAAQSADEMREEIVAMLAESPIRNAEEWAIHDYELGGIDISEYESLDNVSAIALAMDELSKREQEAFAAWYGNQSQDSCDSDELLSDFREQYQGEYRSLDDYAFSIVDETGLLHGVPDSVKNYFDYEKYGRDLELGGDIWTHEAGYCRLHVFMNH